MPKELDKAYEAKKWEDNIYQDWENSGLFKHETWSEKGLIVNKTEAFSVLMPPPNVTGVLHLGHALEDALMDIQARYQRMLGKEVLFIPGTDHAAVATQAKVEKLLMEGKIDGYGIIANPRQEFGRDKLLAIIRDYANQSQQTIIGQIKKMGTSCDWSRLAYTFDETRSNVVFDLFAKMFEEGLIYKGYRVVNWSVKGQSTCSDDELEYKTEKAKLYTFKYAKDFPITIATTRPETKLGDTAVAVNPNDDRYKQYIGQKIPVNFAGVDLVISVVADEQADPNFGTGAVGVTPAHSMVDYDIYAKNKDIGLIQVIGQDGKMTDKAGFFAGQTINDCREKIVTWLRQENLLISEEEIEHNVACSDRFGDVIEVLPMEQWFVDVNKEIPNRNKSLKQLMIEAVTCGYDGDNQKVVKIVPERFKDSYLRWIENLRDWCISRQIWWGHRIPVWYKDGEMKVTKECPGDGWVQDEDTLDTWFSSGAWTFSTLSEEEFKKFHPISWMQMGYEILFFWMARMILMSCYYKRDIPFKEVYIHGILRDADGRKFSKSLGNGIDPILVAESHGADALRLALLANVSAGNDSRFYMEKVDHYRNFVNKLWNISRFILMQIDELSDDVVPDCKTITDKWLLTKLNKMLDQVKYNLNNHNFSQAIDIVYDFTWTDFADWYLEVAKIEGEKQAILSYVLTRLLKIWQPFIPFVTQVIWQEAGRDDLIISQSWPKNDSIIDEVAVEEIELLKKLIIAIRTERNLRKINSSQIININIDVANQEILSRNMLAIEKLTKVKVSEIIEKEIKVVFDGGTLIFDESTFGQSINPVEREKEIDNLKNYIAQQEGKLNNQAFVAKAPASVIEKEKEKLNEAKRKLEELEK